MILGKNELRVTLLLIIFYTNDSKLGSIYQIPTCSRLTPLHIEVNVGTGGMTKMGVYFFF